MQEPNRTVALNLDAEATAVTLLAPHALCVGTAQGDLQLCTATGEALQVSASCSFAGGRVTALRAAPLVGSSAGLVAVVTSSGTGAAAVRAVTARLPGTTCAAAGAPTAPQLSSAAESCRFPDGFDARGLHLSPTAQRIAVASADGQVAVLSVREGDTAAYADEAQNVTAPASEERSPGSAACEAADTMQAPAAVSLHLVAHGTASTSAGCFGDGEADSKEQQMCVHWRRDAAASQPSAAPRCAAASSALVYHVAGARELYLLPVHDGNAGASRAHEPHSAVQLLRCPSAIACSAMCADGSTLLLGLQSACFLAYDTERRCIRTISRLAPSPLVCMHTLAAGGDACAVTADGSTLLWDPSGDCVKHRPTSRLRGAEGMVLESAGGRMLVRGRGGALMWHDARGDAGRRLGAPDGDVVHIAACTDTSVRSRCLKVSNVRPVCFARREGDFRTPQTVRCCAFAGCHDRSTYFYLCRSGAVTRRRECHRALCKRRRRCRERPAGRGHPGHDSVQC